MDLNQHSDFDMGGGGGGEEKGSSTEIKTLLNVKINLVKQHMQTRQPRKLQQVVKHTKFQRWK